MATNDWCIIDCKSIHTQIQEIINNLEREKSHENFGTYSIYMYLNSKFSGSLVWLPLGFNKIKNPSNYVVVLYVSHLQISF